MYVPAVVPGVPVEPPPPLPPPPHAVMLPSAAIMIRTTSIDLQLRRRAGIPRKSRKARTAPPPAPAQPRPLPGSFGEASAALVAAVVLSAMVAVPLVMLELSVTVVGLIEQLGK
jgi:hypothetical protein